MDKTIKKDLMTIYMFRNALATLLGALLAYIISFMQFYQCSLAQALQRLLIYDIYTTLYFVLTWVFDYIVFEMSKILYDIYEEKVTFVPCIILIIISVVIFLVPILDLFQYNLCFLFVLISLRMIKEMWKRTPELFTWTHKLLNKIKKRPESGLK